MNSIKRTVTRFVARIIGYTVYSRNFDANHYCFSFAEALSWMACYPQRDCVVVRRFGNIAAIRRIAVYY